MLAASDRDMEDLDLVTTLAQPYMSQRNMPKPSNWSGVAAGIAAAKQAIEKKDLAVAEEQLREVLEFAPAEADAWHILAAILNRKGQRDEARDCLRRALALKERAEEKAEESSVASALPASRRMAKLLWAQAEHGEALAMLNQLLSTSPADEKLLVLHQQWSATHE